MEDSENGNSATAIQPRPSSPGPVNDSAAANGTPWSCYHSGQNVKTELSLDEIRGAVESRRGTLWVDIDAGNPQQTAMLSDVFHFHPLAIEDSLNPKSRVKIEEYSGFLILIVRTIAFLEETDDPYDIDTVNLTSFLGPNFLVTVHVEQTQPVTATAELLKRKPELAEAGPA